MGEKEGDRSTVQRGSQIRELGSSCRCWPPTTLQQNQRLQIAPAQLSHALTQTHINNSNNGALSFKQLCSNIQIIPSQVHVQVQDLYRKQYLTHNDHAQQNACNSSNTRLHLPSDHNSLSSPNLASSKHAIRFPICSSPFLHSDTTGLIRNKRLHTCEQTRLAQARWRSRECV